MKPIPVMTVAAVAVAIAATGCGSSSKPSYCGKLSDLQSSVKELPSATTSGGVSGLRSQLATVESDARAVVDAARSDFPSETAALSGSVAQLNASARALPSSPSASQLAGVAANASAVVTSVKGFASATSSKCD